MAHILVHSLDETYPKFFPTIFRKGDECTYDWMNTYRYVALSTDECSILSSTVLYTSIDFNIPVIVCSRSKLIIFSFKPRAPFEKHNHSQ